MKKFLRNAIFLASALLLIGQGCVSINSSGDNSSGPGGMFVSTDRAESWKPISNYPTVEGVKNISAASVYRLFQDVQDPDALYWATRGQGFFYSYDAGKTWQRPESPVDTGFIYSIAVSPVDKCTVYASNGRSVYRSTDCNRTWAEVYRENENDIVKSLIINPFPPHQLYLVKENGDVLLSDDDGISWKLASFFKGGNLVEMFSDPNVEGRFYMATRRDGMYRTNDFGSNWESLENGLKGFSGGLEYRRFFVYGPVKDLLYYMSTYGIHRSTDGGDTWEALELIHPPGSALIYGFTINPADQKEMYYTATINNRSTLYKSIDEGESWITRKLPSDQVPTALLVHPEHSERIYLGFTIPPTQ